MARETRFTASLCVAAVVVDGVATRCVSESIFWLST